jgi:hypothetical protein
MVGDGFLCRVALSRGYLHGDAELSKGGSILSLYLREG